MTTVSTALRPRLRRRSHHRNTRALIAGGLGALALVAAACGSSPNSASGAAVVKSESSKYGRIFVDAKGYTLYTYTKDPKNKSVCSGTCATLWHALTVSSTKPNFGGSSGFGVIHGQSGHLQVTYKGRPLYTYTGDTAPGQMNGEGLLGTWYVATVSGSKPSGKTSSTSTTSPGAYGY
jgi:predicted lipoprotein with Yx(FWY)xxD motif